MNAIEARELVTTSLPKIKIDAEKETIKLITQFAEMGATSREFYFINPVVRNHIKTFLADNKYKITQEENKNYFTVNWE